MSQDLREQARRALNKRICVLPAATDGSKRPALATWKQYQNKLPVFDQIDTWFTIGQYDGLGYVCGAISGNLEMFEFEGRAVKEGVYDQFLEAAAAVGLTFVDAIDCGYCEQSPGGGIHWLYRVAGGVGGNTKLACRPGAEPDTVDVLIETRGEGGWTVAAPSGGRTHPTGRSWKMTHGDISNIYTITAEQHSQLLHLARTFDQMPSEASQRPAEASKDRERPTTPTADSERPGDVYNRTATWQEILEPQGWTLVYTRGDIGYWRRPGKTEGISATTNALGTGRLKVFSTSTTFNTDTTYDKFGAYAHLHHAGNIRDAAAALTPPPETVELADILEPQPDHAGQDEPGDNLPKPVHWPTFWKQDHNDNAWILEPFLVRGRSHAIYAPPKTGKSLLVLEAVIALTTGRPYMHQQAIEPVDVIYLDYEMTEDDLYDRLDQMGYDETVNLDRLHYFLIPALEPLDTPAGGKQVERLVSRYNAQVVIFDTTTRAVQGDENDADTIRALYRYTGARLKANGITTLRVDHAGKDITKGQRGTSAKNDDVDIVWQLTGADGQFSIKCTHQRVGYVPSHVGLSRMQDPLGYKITPFQWPAGTVGLARDLDRIGVPVDAGRDKARAAIRAWNLVRPGDEIRTKNDVLSAALRWRKIGQIGDLEEQTCPRTGFDKPERAA